MTNAPKPKSSGHIQIDIAAVLQKADEERDHRLKAQRNALLPKLRALGITTVDATYDGYGDSGNVNHIACQPQSDGVSNEMHSALEDFIWMMAYHQSPGFENNDGGEGSVTWDVAADRITIEHANFYTERNEYLWEDL